MAIECFEQRGEGAAELAPSNVCSASAPVTFHCGVVRGASDVTYTAEVFRRLGNEDETTRFSHDRCSGKFAAADKRAGPRCLAPKKHHDCGAVSGGRIG